MKPFPAVKILGWCVALACVSLETRHVSATETATNTPAASDNIGHDHHRHHHGPRLATEAATPIRFLTSRTNGASLVLPKEQDAFTFAVFGDRTGGPVGGVSVLAEAVHDVNLIGPDLVMTVGDLVNGYNARPAWLEQMHEFKGIMDELLCPWFPVAGNHDVYWRGPGRPVGEHDADYEMHFGPLWYAFTHKRCWFVVLYSDETNPATGEKNFNLPQNHTMSEEQFSWLRSTLAKAKGAEHVFLFLHHPRWTGGKNYGDSWDRVHRELVAAGNVTAVFAGHIHRMRYDPKDGIEYVTLATVGGGQDAAVPEAGWMHEYHLVTVRREGLALSAVPVGEVMDVRELTGAFTSACAAQAESGLAWGESFAFAADGSVAARVRATVTNVTDVPIEITATPASGDSRWGFYPDHLHARIAPGQVHSVEFEVVRLAAAYDSGFRLPNLRLETEVLAKGRRYALPVREERLPMVRASMPVPSVPTEEMVLALDGASAVTIPSEEVALPQGAFTVEAWIRAEAFDGRTGLICKTQASDYGIFVNNGIPSFTVFLGDDYVPVRARKAIPVGQWTHVAGVFDGAEVRLYVDGQRVAAKPGSGDRKTNALPLILGADTTKNGAPVSFFKGQIDAVRLGTGAKYSGEQFKPVRRVAADDGTLLMSNFDAMMDRQVWNDGARREFGRFVGSPRITKVK
jgi:hypothetical protein